MKTLKLRKNLFLFWEGNYKVSDCGKKPYQFNLLFTNYVFCMLFFHLNFKLDECILQMHGCYNSSTAKIYVSYDILLDDNVYHTRDIEIFGIYVSVNYQLNSLIVQLIDGSNPLLT